jgi:acyl-coenzyme A synthetase/AMP-(fatty) acid ligase/pimeloyl-ACP methyl ester carboxylesterase
VSSGAAPASLPPTGLVGLDRAWSRLVTAADSSGDERTWHVLDNNVEQASVTLLCVHGNPTWSYLWRDVVAEAPPGVRVIAVDHLDMGYSERTGTVRRLAQRIEDLEAVVDALEVEGPVVTIAHDWGGPISLGWAARNRHRLAGVVLMNTAVHQPPGSRAPTLIRMARSKPVLNQLAVRTPGFIRGTLRLTQTKLTRPVRAAFHAPYSTASRRQAIGMFVADIPLESDHPSAAALAEVVAGVAEMGAVPTLLLWGPSDPVFSDLYLRDLHARFPQADVHRFIGASHLVSEDADISTPLFEWLARLEPAPEAVVPARSTRSSLWAEIDRRRDDDVPAVIEMDGERQKRAVTFSQLASDVNRVAAGLAGSGVQIGDRVALLVPPGIDLTVCLYACWRIGAVVVIVDAGLGASGMTRAMKSAAPDYLIGINRALAAARSMRWPGRRISVERLSPVQARPMGVWSNLEDIRRRGDGTDLPAPPSDEDVAAVVFTSGATGPAKGVTYRHHQGQAQRDALVQVYEITAADRLVAAFAPFALYGAAMGIPSVVPEMEVTAPGTLRAAALAAAVEAVDATVVFASPAALANVVATAGELTPTRRQALAKVRLVMSAGAPIPAELLRRVSALVPNAELHTPYGMTEVLPVADISLGEIDAAGLGNGVCVGLPVAGVEVAIAPLDESANAAGSLTEEPGEAGEVCIRAPHGKDEYDKLWVTQSASSLPDGWHRSGDVGHLDAEGRLWIEGRMIHLITTAAGVVTPVGIEHAAESVPGVTQAAAVGVGPRGTQQVVLVVVPDDPPRSPHLASIELADRIRAVVDIDVAAVLVVPAVPVDKRHNSKINRTRIATWAEDILAGGRMRRI